MAESIIHFDSANFPIFNPMLNLIKAGLSFKSNRVWSTTNIIRFVAVQAGIACTILLFVCPTCWLTWEGLKDLVPDFLLSFVFSSVMSFGGNLVVFYFDQRISWVEQPIKRIVLTVLYYMTYAFVTSYIIIFCYTYLTGQIPADDIPWANLIPYTKLPMWAALIFMSLFTTWSWLKEWRLAALEAEKLKSEKLAAQYQGLKNQLNPHFLFNSLNALSNLVYEDADRSAAFIQKLSKIYRYVLEVQNEELVTLKREVDFARNYLDLQKIRFEESLQFSIAIQEENNQWLPPLSLQLLLENAIKHNVASKANPLMIQITQKQNEVWISNNFQPKSTIEERSTGIGLKNIEQRYLVLSDQQPEVRASEQEFLVILPLLKIES